MAGVTTQGFVAKTVADLLNDLNASWRSVFGNAVNVDPRSRHGQMIAALASPLSEVWQLGEALAGVYSNPSGLLLDYISALTGTTRRAATSSAVVLTLTGTAGTVVGAGKIAAVTGTTAQFATTGSATLVAVTAWATGQTIAAGDRRKNGGNVYQASQGGVTAGAGPGPSGTGTGIVDNSVVWFFLGAGAAAVDSPAACTVTGPVQGYSGTINVISTPVGGWSGVYNVLDAAPGTNLETDPELRTRRASEAAGQGRSPLPSIRTQLLRVAGVTSVIVFENTSDLTVGTMAPHSIECLVLGGTDGDVAAAIFKNKAAGIATDGTSSQSINDQDGNGHTINFSRPSNLNIYTATTVAVDVTQFPANGAAQVQDAIVAAGNALGQGHDVYATAVAGALFAKDADGNLLIPGVLDVPSSFVDTAPSPVSSSVSVTQRQIPVFDTSRSAVTIIQGTP